MNSQQIHLASRPSGMLTQENFKFVEVELPSIQEGEVLIKNTWMSVDPYMRGRMVVTVSYIAPSETAKV